MPAYSDPNSPIPESPSEIDSLHFNRGEFCLICGPTGAGKTRLLKLHSKKLSSFSYLPQGIQENHQDQRLIDAFAYHLRLYTAARTVEITKRLEQQFLTWNLLHVKNFRCSDLSFGEYRRFQLALCLAIEAELYLLDEPFLGMDIEGSVMVLKHILQLKERGAGIVFATTKVDTCLAHADRLILIKSNRIIVDALPERALPFLATHGVYRSKLRLKDMSILDYEVEPE